MRPLIFASVAALAIATPAIARDNSPYFGIEGGITRANRQSLLGTVTFTNTTANGPANFTTTNIGSSRGRGGYDIDAIGGYDFGAFRLEGELGYKSVKRRTPTLSNGFITAINTGAGTTYSTTTDFNLSRRTSVWSAMVNGLADFGGQTGIGAYVGAGAGYARVRNFGASNGKFAWQLLAGVYMPVSSNIDIGLKYRYFNAGRSNGMRNVAFATGATTCGTAPSTFACSPGTAVFESTGKYRSHSLLLSLTYNLGAPAAVPAAPTPPPPPPAPAAPATQTCPDGSVIDATATCPAPPPPPPPPPPAQRGERGR